MVLKGLNRLNELDRGSEELEYAREEVSHEERTLRYAEMCLSAEGTPTSLHTVCRAGRHCRYYSNDV